MSPVVIESMRDLVPAALLGTERRPAPIDGGKDVVSRLVEATEEKDPAARLLSAAAVAALRDRAGAASREAPPPLEPCPPDALPRCSPRSAALLGRVLRGEHAQVLPEILDLLEAAGRRAPEELLPHLLDLAARDGELRPRVLAVGGRRAAWLASLNPHWRAAAGEATGETWETGGAEARVEHLRGRRRVDPPGARELLAAAWKDETAQGRTALLDALRTSLGPDDEPFLEEALGDKSKSVRRAAADLLARLPGSRLVARMTDRSSALVRFVPATRRKILGLKAGRPPAIEVGLPTEDDPSLAKDAVEPQPPQGEKLGKRAWVLLQILAASDPDVLSARLGAEPGVLAEAAAANEEWGSVLLRGWARAAARLGRARWGEVLPARVLLEEEPEGAAALVESWPPERREAAAIELLRSRREPLEAADPASTILGACRHVWSPALTAEFLGAVHKALRSGTYGQRREAVLGRTKHLDPGTAARTVGSWVGGPATSGGRTGEHVVEILRLVEFRQDVRDALRSEASEPDPVKGPVAHP